MKGTVIISLALHELIIPEGLLTLLFSNFSATTLQLQTPVYLSDIQGVQYISMLNLNILTPCHWFGYGH